MLNKLYKINIVTFKKGTICDFMPLGVSRSEQYENKELVGVHFCQTFLNELFSFFFIRSQIIQKGLLIGKKQLNQRLKPVKTLNKAVSLAQSSDNVRGQFRTTEI